MNVYDFFLQGCNNGGCVELDLFKCEQRGNKWFLELGHGELIKTTLNIGKLFEKIRKIYSHNNPNLYPLILSIDNKVIKPNNKKEQIVFWCYYLIYLFGYTGF